MAPNHLFLFDDFRLDERERRLVRGGEPIPLPPKLFDLLAALVHHAGRLVDKDELLDTVWADVIVEEGTLTRGISSLRRLLGSVEHGREYIETVPKRGYRFVADVHEAPGESTDDPSDWRIPLPPAAGAMGAVHFVGRTRELEQMEEVWRRARSGHHQLLLIGGEPGIGKTRLSLEFACSRAAEGATVLVGCCDEENLVPYQPFVEALSWYFRHCPQKELRRQLAAAGVDAELAAFVPELQSRVPDLPRQLSMNPEAERYRLFEAVAALLAVMSLRCPMLLVLEDVHWADKATLLLLRHVVRSARMAPFTIIATYRQSELGHTYPLADMLMKLRHEPRVTRLGVRGLEVVHVGALIDSIIGSDAPPDLPAALLERTDGNPLFATEMLLHLKETTPSAGVSALPLSQGIREVILRRLSRLTGACNQVLRVASVIGREFDASLLQIVSELPDTELLASLEEAVGAQLIRELPRNADRFEFVHALIREALYGELGSARRVRLHRRTGDAIERLAATIPRPPFSELAYHFFHTASPEAAEKAVEYATLAGACAAGSFAHEEAARLFELALQSLDRAAAPDLDERRVDLHVRRARAFDALGQWTLEVGELEAALRHLHPSQVERRCTLLLDLARAVFLLLDVRPVERYAADALRLAEELGRADLAASALAWIARCRQAAGDLSAAIELDRSVLARTSTVATATHMLGPLTLYLAGRSTSALDLATRAADAARASGDTTFVMYALTHLGLNTYAVGRYAEAAEAFREVRTFGRKYGALPMLARATAMTAGLHLTLFDFDGAESLQAEARELGRSVGFAPSVVSAGIDALLTLARQHDPGRAERLFRETVAAAESTADWHQWLWRLRLTQARAELALERSAFDEATTVATEAIERSRSKGRPKYEALALVTRTRAYGASGRTALGIVDANGAVAIAERIDDPALLLLCLDALITLEGTDSLVARARTTIDRISDAIGTSDLRRAFLGSEIVRRVRKL
jgi:DNA-binding winged helix-turn-helix (wHTH) protein/tetratricopeptide (TPR) repeat protein